jgi:hypothetical protein
MKSVSFTQVLASASHCVIRATPGPAWLAQVTVSSGPKPVIPSVCSRAASMVSASIPSRICAGVMSGVPASACALRAASAASMAAKMPRLYCTVPTPEPSPARLPASIT